MAPPLRGVVLNLFPVYDDEHGNEITTTTNGNWRSISHCKPAVAGQSIAAMSQSVEPKRTARACGTVLRSVMGNECFRLAEVTRETVSGSGDSLSRAGVRLAAAEALICERVFATRLLVDRPISVRHRELGVRRGPRTNPTSRSDTVNAPSVEAIGANRIRHEIAQTEFTFERLQTL